MKLLDYPNLSNKFNKVYKKYLDHGADPQVGLNAVAIFLKKYPLYSEALIFKARMLIVLSKNKEAISYLKAAQKIDRWKVTSVFDEAEILYQWGKKEEAFQAVWRAVESIIGEATSGVENYLLSTNISTKDTEIAQKLFKDDMVRLILMKAKPRNMTRIKKILGKNTKRQAKAKGSQNGV